MKTKYKISCAFLMLAAAVTLLAPVTVFAAETGEAAVTPDAYATPWALIPPVVAIVLALITKEVYSSLFIGILVGALLNCNFNIETSVVHIFKGGIISVLSDSYNVGILVFLVILGAMEVQRHLGAGRVRI